jgi:hypothetical protein
MESQICLKEVHLRKAQEGKRRMEELLSCGGQGNVDENPPSQSKCF